MYVCMHVYMSRECWVILVGTPRSQFNPEAGSTLNGSGPCLFDARFNEHREMSHPAGTQATLTYEIKASK